MTDTNTFSAAIDEAVLITRRPNMRRQIASYLLSTLRELEVTGYYRDTMVEDQVTTSDDPYIWTRPVNFREWQYVEYSGIVDAQGKPIVPKQRQPSVGQRDAEYYFYESADSTVFAAHGGTIKMAYWQFLPVLAYYEAEADRPATYDILTNTWTYKTAVTDEEKAAAQAAVTNFILFNWFAHVVEGVCAKTFKMVGDGRAVSSFALFQSYKRDFVQGVPSIGSPPTQ